MRRPESISYWLGERPPVRVALGLAVQQVAFLGALLTVPAYFASKVGLSPVAFEHLAAATLLYGAVTLLLHAWGRFGIGSGLFIPLQGTTASIPAVLMVATETDGGLAAGFGMVAVIGVTQFLFSGLFQRLRGILSVEIVGLAGLLVGSGIGQLGLRLIFEPEYQGAPQMDHLITAGVTFMTIVTLNVWGRGLVKTFATLIGLCVGLALSFALPSRDLSHLDTLSDNAWFALPELAAHGLGWDWAHLVPYIVTGVALSLTSMGVQTVAQRFNDADFNRPDLPAIGRGLRAEGLGMGVAALFNALPMTASGGAVSLAAASGCTSRSLAYWTAGLMTVLAFMPKVIMAWLLLPNAVAGGLFLFLSCFATLSGLQLIGSRLLDNRRVLAVGTGLLIGMTHAQIKDSVESAAPFLHGFLFSPFAIGLTAAIALSALFRLGRSRKARATLDLGEATLETVTTLVETQGRVWAIPHATAKRAELAVWQLVDLLMDRDLVHGFAPSLEVLSRFDDLRFTLTLRWTGLPIDLGATTAPSADAMLEDPDAPARMAAHLIRGLADRATLSTDGSRVEARLTFSA
jgi:xanthine/uracil permease